MKERQRSESIIRDIRRKTRKRYNSEEKIRIVLEGLRGGDNSSGAMQEGSNKSKCIL